jgi:FkbM family methyltransferase
MNILSKARTAIFTDHGRRKAINIVRAWKLNHSEFRDGKPVVYKLKDGRPFLVHPEDALSMQIFLDQSYEGLETAFCNSYAKAGDFVMDLGANVGYFTALLSGLVGSSGAVFAFEPGSKTFAKLERTKELLGLANVDLNCLAVSDQSGVCKFAQSLTGMDQHQHIVRPDEESGNFSMVEMPSTSLDDFVKAKNIPNQKLSLIKCDVEANELQVLRGAQTILNCESPPAWLTEVRIRKRNGAVMLPGARQVIELFQGCKTYFAPLGEEKLYPMDQLEPLMPELINIFAFPLKGIHAGRLESPRIQSWKQQFGLTGNV